MSAGEGSSAGVCASFEAQKVPHVSRWAAVHLLLFRLFNILSYSTYTSVRRYCTVIPVVHDSAKVIEYTVVQWLQP